MKTETTTQDVITSLLMGRMEVMELHGVRTFTQEELERLATTEAGPIMIGMMRSLTWDLESATRNLEQGAETIKRQAESVLEATRAGHRVESSWLESSTRSLHEHAAKRQYTVDQLVAIAHLATSTLELVEA